MKQRRSDIFFATLIISLPPAITIGAVVSWLAWDKSHIGALVSSGAVFFALMWYGFWLATVLYDTGGWIGDEPK